ncbi:unnamed protein product (macronuclear) [Paramecium tetraurelia]|uniref:ER membrane protein complex subunit 10 n=1 Tax=Paramecium tetraurelia TaxID=5888 RepID=A0DQ71_PARTE|nr:uncharacterized protein GSPATT00002588001 [Paramecium tetraurelia]CAK85188.1 unnamed protein product [Paramecium tetraurelia]|eukprot:XP_001452585.1 hypothetical protein (macronuclear) [Paramecium tetraurelia strain d4-2]
MQFTLLLALALTTLSQSTDFALLIKSSNSQAWERIGDIKIPRSNFQNAQIVLNQNKQQIIDRKKINENNYALLKLQNQQDEKSYIAHIDGKQLSLFNQKSNYQEVITFVLSNNDLLSFDYALKPIRKNAETYIQVNIKELEVAPSGLVPQFEDKTPEEEEQQKPQGIFGLILQYKWYIIIGFIVFFLTGQADPQKLNETVQQAQEQAQASKRRNK